jgi:hypothetical protein
MTTCRLTHHSLFNNSSLPKTLQWFTPPPHLPNHAPCVLYYYPRWNYGWKDVVLTRLKRSTQNRKWLSIHIWELPGMREIVGNALGSLYTFTRGLLWRRRWKLEITVRTSFLWSNSQNFGVAPSTHMWWSVIQTAQRRYSLHKIILP